MIETFRFGRTGHISTRTIFGAAALGPVTQEEADQTLELLLQFGVNHIDTAASYGDSEERIGPWMAKHRGDFFLASKTGRRTYDEAKAEIERSLRRLQVEQIDLLQLHCLIDEHDWEVAMGPDGALKAAIEARDAGLIRYIGVTGHGVVAPKMHLRSLERFDFDTVLLPWNYTMSQNVEYLADFRELEALCQERDVPLQTIKAVLRRPWSEQKQDRTTWYQPLEEQEDINTAVDWLLSHPGLFLNTVGDIHVLPKVLKAASRFHGKPSDEEMERLMEKQGMATLFV